MYNTIRKMYLERRHRWKNNLKMLRKTVWKNDGRVMEHSIFGKI